jgi:hypothetical protein
LCHPFFQVKHPTRDLLPAVSMDISLSVMQTTYTKINVWSKIEKGVLLFYIYNTSETDASDAMARISAQETMPGQALSNAVFMSSTTPKPLTELLFGPASFSLSMVSVLFNKIDPSHPYNKVNMFLQNLDNQKCTWCPILIRLREEEIEQKMRSWGDVRWQSNHGNEAW